MIGNGNCAEMKAVAVLKITSLWLFRRGMTLRVSNVFGMGKKKREVAVPRLLELCQT